MRRLTHLFKYGHKTGLRHDFALLLNTFITTSRVPTGEFDLIIPVPLHPVRLRERGYNQAALLSGMLAERWGIRQSAGNLIRVRHTRNQAALRKKERWTNVRAAFRISFPSEIDGKSILLVDDLMTTGATLSEAARVLKDAKVKNVAALTLAMTSTGEF
jgi:ComF family protein